MQEILKTMGKGLGNSILLILAIAAIMLVFAGPGLLATISGGVWLLLYTPHILTGVYLMGKE